MSDSTTRDEVEDELPTAVIRGKRGGRLSFSTLWIIPLVAAVIGLTLAYRAWEERGVTVTISFQNADGLTAGKTPIRYLGVSIGMVEQINVGGEFDDVIVTARLHRESATHLVKGTRFWIVKPRLGTGGVSGLSTLVSGDYIAMDPGKKGGGAKKKFTGLPEPPLDAFGWQGIRVELHANRLHGVEVGSPVIYRDVIVGAIGRYKFNGEKLVLEALINEPYRNFVRANSRFWNASGFDLKAGVSGVKFHLESAITFIQGGVSFDTFGKQGEAAKEGASFQLYSNKEQSKASYLERLGLHITLEASQLGSIEEGDPVSYREMVVGRVLNHDLHPDGRSVGILIQIDTPYEKFVRSNTVFWNTSGISADLSLTGFHIHTNSLESLVKGGVAFATPDSTGEPVARGSVFELHPKARDSWQGWSPSLESPPKGEPVKLHHKVEGGKKGDALHWFKGLFSKKHQ